MKWIIFMIMGLFVIAGCAPQPQIIVDSSSGSAINTVSVSGQAKEDVEPDLVQIILKITSQEETAVLAQQTNAKKTTDVFATFKELNIGEDEYETVSVRLYPNNKWDGNLREYVNNGYVAEQSVQIRTEKIDDTGKILDAVVKSGTSTIQSVSFTLSDAVQDTVKKRLMKSAVEDAAEKADIFAGAADRKRGIATVINEGSIITPRPLYRDTMALSVSSLDESSTPIQAGDVTVTMSVGVVYQLE